MEYDFEPFDRVLVRSFGIPRWAAAFYSHYEDGMYVTCGGQTWDECIPYEGNEGLLNSLRDPD